MKSGAWLHQMQTKKLDLEKEDKNLDYGAYYYDDGERRQDVVEVAFWFPWTNICIFECFRGIHDIRIIKSIEM